MAYDKEAIYDEQIAPLMAQILAITEREGIQMLASFALKDRDPDFNGQYSPLICTSYTPGDTWNGENLLDARYVALGQKKAVSNVMFSLITSKASE